MIKTKCESCKLNPVQWILTSSYGYEKPYKICSNCHIYLIDLALTPTMFFNLIKSGHKGTEFLLHDDFYDQFTGEALQSRN